MMDFDKILHGFQPERFRRINLRQRHFYNMPGLEYYVRLDAYTAWLEDKLAAARETIAMSGNNYYMHDSKEWCKNWNAKLREIGELKAEKITLEAEKNAEIRRLQLENEYLQEKLEAYEAAENPKSQRRRNSATGQFVAETTKFDKMFKAYDMDRKGYNHAQISRTLSVSPETVKRYIRDYPNELRKKCGSSEEEEA